MIVRTSILSFLLLSQLQLQFLLLCLCPGHLVEAAACQACLFPVSFHHMSHHRQHYPHHHQPHQKGTWMGSVNIRRSQHVASSLMPFGIIAARHFTSRHFHTRSIFCTDQEANKHLDDSEKTLDETTDSDTLTRRPPNKEEESPASIAAIGAIRFYKGFISPLLPPACRFVPTCSQYGVQAIEEFGLAKGCTLIAWRLLRCSPIGGKGYDPPKWPPVPFNYASY